MPDPKKTPPPQIHPKYAMTAMFVLFEILTGKRPTPAVDSTMTHDQYLTWLYEANKAKAADLLAKKGGK